MLCDRRRHAVQRRHQPDDQVDLLAVIQRVQLIEHRPPPSGTPMWLRSQSRRLSTSKRTLNTAPTTALMRWTWARAFACQRMTVPR